MSLHSLKDFALHVNVYTTWPDDRWSHGANYDSEQIQPEILQLFSGPKFLQHQEICHHVTINETHWQQNSKTNSNALLQAARSSFLPRASALLWGPHPKEEQPSHCSHTHTCHWPALHRQCPCLWQGTWDVCQITPSTRVQLLLKLFQSAGNILGCFRPSPSSNVRRNDVHIYAHEDSEWNTKDGQEAQHTSALSKLNMQNMRAKVCTAASANNFSILQKLDHQFKATWCLSLFLILFAKNPYESMISECLQD